MNLSNISKAIAGGLSGAVATVGTTGVVYVAVPATSGLPAWVYVGVPVVNALISIVIRIIDPAPDPATAYVVAVLIEVWIAVSVVLRSCVDGLIIRGATGCRQQNGCNDGIDYDFHGLSPGYCRRPSPLLSAATKSFMNRVMNSSRVMRSFPFASAAEN